MAKRCLRAGAAAMAGGLLVLSCAGARFEEWEGENRTEQIGDLARNSSLTESSLKGESGPFDVDSGARVPRDRADIVVEQEHILEQATDAGMSRGSATKPDGEAPIGLAANQDAGAGAQTSEESSCDAGRGCSPDTSAACEVGADCQSGQCLNLNGTSQCCGPNPDICGECAAAGSLVQCSNRSTCDQTPNPDEAKICEAYLRCWVAHECGPNDVCAALNGVCGVNQIGSMDAKNLASEVWDCHCAG